MRALLTFGFAIALAGCSVISIDLTPRIRPLEEETVEGHGASKILLLDVSGFLSDEPPSAGVSLGTPPPRVPMLVRLREELNRASGDDAVKALIVRINTPGGTVTASDIMYQEIERFRESTHRPVVAVMMDVAASGGYYVALAADTIVAHPTTVTGSIGTIMISLNAQGLMQKLGLATESIKSADHKDMGSPFRPLTSEERAIFQSVIDELQHQFVAKVVERRRLPPPVAARLADGRIYTAPQALERGLIDQIGYMPEAIEAARRAAGVDTAKIVVYKRPREYRATYYASARGEGPSLGGTLGEYASLAAPGPKFLYLWAP